MDVDDLSMAFYMMSFRERYLTAEADTFQDLFAGIMERAHPGDFAKVQPWGNKGDLKCDGYLASERMVFACYGPKEFSPMHRVLAKVNGDHSGALKHWKPHMSAWTFVHNDYHGLPAEVLQLLLDLDAADSTVAVVPWGEPQLRTKVRGLSLIDLTELFGSVPTARQMRALRQEDLQRVIPVLVGAIAVEPFAADLRPVPPEKLEYNKLSDSARLLLVSGMQVSDRVRVFFERWEPGVGDRIAAAFKQRYVALRADARLSPDDVLWALFEYAGHGHLQSIHEQTAVLALLAHLFESCEIFDRPQTAAVTN